MCLLRSMAFQMLELFFAAEIQILTNCLGLSNLLKKFIIEI